MRASCLTLTKLFSDTVRKCNRGICGNRLGLIEPSSRLFDKSSSSNRFKPLKADRADTLKRLPRILSERNAGKARKTCGDNCDSKLLHKSKWVKFDSP